MTLLFWSGQAEALVLIGDGAWVLVTDFIFNKSTFVCYIGSPIQKKSNYDHFVYTQSNAGAYQAFIIIW